jgi:hypothetical protein
MQIQLIAGRIEKLATGRSGILGEVAKEVSIIMLLRGTE